MISPALSRLAFLCVAVMCAVTCLPVNASAQETTTGEDVAIAFFKTGDSNPDFDLWAKSSKEYKVAPPARADEALFNEKQRLFTKWRAYDPDADVLNVSGNVRVELKAVTLKSGEEQFWMYMIFPEGDVTYFPYKFLEYHFAVIPQQIETLMIQQLQKEQYDMILSSFSGSPAGNAVLHLQLKPARAYMQQPYIIDNKEQWALLCDIATMSLISARAGKTMWNYGADWYVSPVTQELRDLYQQPTGSAGTPAQ